MRILGREKLRRIKNCESAQLDATELRSVCEMAELHRQHVRHLERRGRQVERTAHSKNQYMSIEEAQKVWHILNSRAEKDRKRGLKVSRAIASELIYLLMTEAGLRVQEVCDFTFEGCPVEHGGCCLDFVGKGNKQRIVTVSTETETITKKGRFDLKGLADFMKRRKPDRYHEKREIGASDEVQEFIDWIAGRNDSDNDAEG